MDIIEKIISNFKNNKSLYIGENVTIAEHMIQSAMMAEKSKSKDNFICSCLLFLQINQSRRQQFEKRSIWAIQRNMLQRNRCRLLLKNLVLYFAKIPL